MATPKKAKRDWLEPPDWWRKWKPLRWLAAALVLVSLVSFIRSLMPDDPEPAAPPPPETVADTPPEPSSPPAPGQVVEPSQAALEAEPPTPATPRGYVPPKPTAATAAPPVTPAPVPAPAPAPAPPAEEIEPLDDIDERSAPVDAQVAAFTSVEDKRVVLMGLFRSYSSVDAISEQLRKLNVADVPVTSNHRRLKRTDIPPYDLDNITIDGFQHLGQSGKLTLSFFNDRLYEADFRPAAPEDYLKALRRAEPRLTRTRTGRTEFSDGPLYVSSSLDLAVSDVGRTLGTKAFVLWQDQRIVKQRDAWDGLFAVKAAS